MIRSFTEGVYDNTIKRGLDKPSLDIYTQDHEMFLLDFYAFDESRLFRRFENDDDEEDSQQTDSQEEEEIPEEDKPENQSQFRVRVFGVIESKPQTNNQEKTQANNQTQKPVTYSASLDILNYKPNYYIKIPDHWTDYELTDLIAKLKHEAEIDPKKWRSYEHLLLDAPHSKIVKRKPFYNYTGDEQFQYAQLVFSSNNGFFAFSRLIERLQKREPRFWRQFELMESNIDPMLRLMHVRDITFSGWIKLPKQATKLAKKTTSDCQVHFEIDYLKIVPLNSRTDIPKLVVAGFDIEANSSHGDFPIADKNYQKLAQDIITEYLKLPEVKSAGTNNLNANTTNSTNLYLRSLLYRWIVLAFDNFFDNNNINRIPTKNNEKPDEETVDYLVKIIEETGEKYHHHLDQLNQKNLDDPNLRQQVLETYSRQLLIHLESNLPELDFNPPKVFLGNYQLLSEQLLKEYMRLLTTHSRAFLDDPTENIKFMLNLAFDDYYDNHTINKVYCKREIKPEPDTLLKIIPQVHQICQECYAELNKPPAPKKASTTDPCKPKKSLLEPPPKNQKKLSDLLKSADQPTTDKTKLALPKRINIKDFLKNKATNIKEDEKDLEAKRERILDNEILTDDEDEKPSKKDESDEDNDERMEFLRHIKESRQEQAEMLAQNVSFLPKKTDARFKHTITAKEYQQEKDDKGKPKKTNTWKQEEVEEPAQKKGRYIKPRPLKDNGEDENKEENPHDNPEDPDVKREGSGDSDDDPEIEQELAKIGRDFFVSWLHEVFDTYLPDVEGDPVIQIGTTFKRYGEEELFLKHIITLKGTNQIFNTQIIDDENKDIFIENVKDAIAEGKKLGIVTDLYAIIEQKEKEAILAGIKKPKIPEMETLNRMLYIARRDKQLANDKAVVRIECYDTERDVLLAWKELIKQTDPDIVIGYNIFGFDFKFMYERAQVLGIEEDFTDLSRIKIFPEPLVDKKLVSSGLGDNRLYYIPMTGRVVVDLLKVVQSGGHSLPIYKLDFVCHTFLNKRKNDMHPQEMFVKQKGSDQDRTEIARYCLIDCILCNRLIDRLEIITNTSGMSRVCSVPLSYLFLRGQGIKIFSFIAKKCLAENMLIKTKDRNDNKDQEGYEGACVLEPKKGIYFEPVAVADFNSLYPSCMIASNLSHDAYIPETSKYYHTLPKERYCDISYDIYREEQLPGKKSTVKVKAGVRVDRFYQPPNGQKSLVPRVLDELLKARKATRKDQEKFPKGSFEWAIKESLQLAFKVIANSVYGQCGASSSSIYLKSIASSTTACGRGLIHSSKAFFEKTYSGCEIIYGDTDSIFVKFDCKNIRGEKLYGLDGLYKSMELCMEGALGITRTLKNPHNLDFEKAIGPFMLLSKKRYHGHYFTDWGTPYFKAKSMGIVLKRRDNCEIVKHIFGGVINIIMKEHDILKAKDFCKKETSKLLKGEFPIEMLTVTKTLKSYYKNPDQIAHNVLAQRIGERDPGNKPHSNERMMFAYITVPEPSNKDIKILQGDKIETPDYIKSNNLHMDYRFYLTNQVIKPVTQIFELEMNEKELGEIFIDSLIEYDRDMSGAKRLSNFVNKREEYTRQRQFIDQTLENIIKEIRKEEDQDIIVKDGDEVL